MGNQKQNQNYTEKYNNAYFKYKKFDTQYLVTLHNSMCNGPYYDEDMQDVIFNSKIHAIWDLIRERGEYGTRDLLKTIGLYNNYDISDSVEYDQLGGKLFITTRDIYINNIFFPKNTYMLFDHAATSKENIIFYSDRLVYKYKLIFYYATDEYDNIETKDNFTVNALTKDYFTSNNYCNSSLNFYVEANGALSDTVNPYCSSADGQPINDIFDVIARVKYSDAIKYAENIDNIKSNTVSNEITLNKNNIVAENDVATSNDATTNRITVIDRLNAFKERLSFLFYKTS